MKKIILISLFFFSFSFFNRDLQLRDLEKVEYFGSFFEKDLFQNYINLSGWEAERETPELRLY